MFKKLLANLPFNPSLLEDLVTYAKQTKHEASLRKAGFWLLILAIVTQFAVKIYPPQLSPAGHPLLPLGIGFVLALISGFMYARSRIIALELEIIRLSYITAGGI